MAAPSNHAEQAGGGIASGPADAVRIDAAGATEIGRERARNEDQFLVAALERTMRVANTSIRDDTRSWLPHSVEGTLLVVADGMGGHGGGDVASAVAVRALAEYLCNVMPWFDSVPVSRMARQESLPGVRDGLRSAVAQSDREVRRAAKSGHGASDMGTTLTVAYLRFPQLYLAHVGDSRCYLLRDDTMFQLTRDHTVAEQLRERGQPSLNQGSPFHHVLWNAIGGGGGTQPRPELRRMRLMIGDALVLCSDGLTKHLSDDDIAACLQAAPSAAQACERLVGEANARGGSDNITVVVARCLGDRA